MANFKRTLTKFGSGFLGGLASGGWGGAFTGGTVAAFTGGKAKPLKSAAIGAGAGFLGGFVSQKMGWQGPTANVGGYTFKPLSSRALDYMAAAKKAPASSTSALPNILDALGAGSAPALPSELPPGSGPYGTFPLASDYQAQATDEGSGGGWLPVAVAAGALLLLGAA